MIHLNGHELYALYKAVPDEAAMLKAIDCTFRSDRKFDKAIQTLKKWGVVVYVKGKGWQKTGADYPGTND